MLENLNVDQARFIALLAKTARLQRDTVLGDVPERGVHGGGVDERADVYARFQTIADFQRLHAGDEGGEEFFGKAALDIDAVGRDARLAGVAKLRD